MSDLDEFKAKFENLLRLRQARDKADRVAKAANQEYRAAESELYQELEDAGIRGRLEFDFGGDLGVAKFERRATAFGRVIDKQAAIAALRKAGLVDMLTEDAISEKRLNEYARDMLETNGEFAAGTDYYHRKVISISQK